MGPWPEGALVGHRAEPTPTRPATKWHPPSGPRPQLTPVTNLGPTPLAPIGTALSIFRPPAGTSTETNRRHAGRFFSTPTPGSPRLFLRPHPFPLCQGVFPALTKRKRVG